MLNSKDMIIDDALQVTKAELDDFKPGRQIPYCSLQAHPLHERFPHLLYNLSLAGIKPPYNSLILTYFIPSRKLGNCMCL